MRRSRVAVAAALVGVAALGLVQRAAAASSLDEGLLLLHQKGCRACHSVDGSSGVGPSFRGLFGSAVRVRRDGDERSVVVDEAFVARALKDPGAEVRVGFPAGVMPRVELAPREQALLIETLRSLAAPEPVQAKAAVDFETVLLTAFALLAAAGWWAGRRLAQGAAVDRANRQFRMDASNASRACATGIAKSSSPGGKVM